jgi:hypothetical protein
MAKAVGSYGTPTIFMGFWCAAPFLRLLFGGWSNQVLWNLSFYIGDAFSNLCHEFHGFGTTKAFF